MEESKFLIRIADKTENQQKVFALIFVQLVVGTSL